MAECCNLLTQHWGLTGPVRFRAKSDGNCTTVPPIFRHSAAETRIATAQWPVQNKQVTYYTIPQYNIFHMCLTPGEPL